MAAVSRRSEIEALLTLDALPGIGTRTVHGLVERFGSGRAALASGLAGSPASTADARAAARAAADRARGLDMDTLLHTDADYPEGLRHLADPPPLLFLRGNRELLRTPGLAVVGSRRATARGRSVARRLGAAVAGAGVSVVSGLALGVDGEAHRGALEASGPTVAVLGRGADAAYPRSHWGLFRDILRRGLVVSEFPPGTPALPHHFPRRNRILAALCRAVVVVEAAARSGALITVEHALDLGLDVFAVPGPIDQAPCRGSNGLLADGARPLVSVSAFVEDYLGVGRRETDAPPAEGEAGRVLARLEDGTASADELARVLGMDAGRTLALLSRLEMAGSVERVPGMRFRRAG